MNIPTLHPKLAVRVLDLAVKIQQIPAPTFAEKQRADFILSRFRKEGLKDVSRDKTGNVYARLPGAGAARPFVVSAHLDTVFPLETDLTISSSAGKMSAPGLGDNSLGVAALFGLVWSLQAEKVQLPGDVWLVGNVAEEGLGNLLGMHAVVDRFGADPLAYVVLEGMSYGSIYHRGLGVQRFRISAHTSGGHSWSDFGRPSAVHELAEIVHQLNAMPLSREPRASLNVGSFHGGVSVNTIAPFAELELDLRSEDSHILDRMAAQVKDLVSGIDKPDLELRIESIGLRPVGSLPVDHPLVSLSVRVLQAHDTSPQLSVGSTDANVPLSRGYPAVCLGVTTGGGAHSAHEYIDTPPIIKGITQLHALVQSAFDELGG